MGQKNILIVEGENEKHFFEEFKDYLTSPMEIKVCNVLQEKIKKNITGKKYDIACFVFDIDVLCKNNSQNQCIEKLDENFKSILSKKKYILIESKNLEDEFVRCSEGLSSFKELCSIFNCKQESTSEFKKKFNNSKNLPFKEGWKLKILELYSEGIKYLDLFGLKNNLKSNIKSGKNIFKKDSDKRLKNKIKKSV